MENKISVAVTVALDVVPTSEIADRDPRGGTGHYEPLPKPN